ncbi:MAG TPA: argininosuccinate lyase [Terriglobales bacterium]|jgi:argininosuccinate lyase|nr:argininosuccinate lyase [Terriglobales bacterium]
MKMWSGRFRQPLDPEFERWQRSFDFDRRLLTHELAASSAHARALKGAGILDSTELIAILQGLEQIAEQAASSSAFLEDQEAEDVHHFVEKKLVSLIGDVGYKLHSGRSRNEQIATDLRLYVRAAIDQIRADLAAWCSSLLERAQQAGNAAMPAYTHLQRAEPVLVSHWLLAYIEMFLRDADRLADCRKRLNACPLGSGAVAGATLPLDRRGMAADLEFDQPTANSIDATSDRDFAVEFVNTLSLLALHLSRCAEEMILFSSQEYGFLQLPEAYSTGSSALPQKKNPDLLELTRGKCARVIGAATALQICLKGLPLAYNKDLQETQEPLFDATDTVLALLPLATGWMKAVELNYETMQKAAQSGFMDAWAAATYLVQRGVPFRLAHEQIGKAVQICLEKHCELQDLSLEELHSVNAKFDHDFFAFVKLESVLAVHDVPGGTAPARVRQALLDAQKRIELIREDAHAHA